MSRAHVEYSKYCSKTLLFLAVIFSELCLANLVLGQEDKFHLFETADGKYSKRAKLKVDVPKIYGRIMYVDSFPDYKVQIVNSFPNLKAQVVKSFPNKPGKWKIVNSFPDYKIQIVNSFPDFTVQYVKSFPGVP